MPKTKRGTIQNDSPPEPAIARRKGESAKAYAAFKLYIELGDTRSIPKVAAKCRKSETLLRRWSAKWKWQERLARIHSEEAQQRSDAQSTVALENAKLREQRRAKLEKDSWELSELLRAKAREMLNFPTTKQTVHQDGKVIHIHPGPFRLGDAARMTEVADALGRISMGMPSKITEVGIGGKGGGPLVAPKVRLKVLTNKESDAVLREMRVDVG
jgi:hypothetical protein